MSVSAPTLGSTFHILIPRTDRSRAARTALDDVHTRTANIAFAIDVQLVPHQCSAMRELILTIHEAHTPIRDGTNGMGSVLLPTP